MMSYRSLICSRQFSFVAINNIFKQPNHNHHYQALNKHKNKLIKTKPISFTKSYLQQQQWRRLLLPAKEDEHGGLILEMQDQTRMDSKLFGVSLRSSLSYWTQLGKRGIWIKLAIKHANLIEVALKEGFRYHHAEAEYVMLTKWLPKDEPNSLPANASHRVSVGAFVINHNKQVLVVQEKNGMLRGKGVWKFPTGMINQGEDICAAAAREVKEETGIETRFVEVLTFREHHKAFFQKSDLFFVCLLQPLSSNIQVQESEIEAAQWMPFEEYAAQSFVQRYEMLRYLVQICKARMDGNYSGFPGVPIKASFRDGMDFIYFSKQNKFKNNNDNNLERLESK